MKLIFHTANLWHQILPIKRLKKLGNMLMYLCGTTIPLKRLTNVKTHHHTFETSHQCQNVRIRHLRTCMLINYLKA